MRRGTFSQPRSSSKCNSAVLEREQIALWQFLREILLHKNALSSKASREVLCLCRQTATFDTHSLANIFEGNVFFSGLLGERIGLPRTCANNACY